MIVMTRRHGRSIATLVLAAVTAACASSGARVPRPFPGAALPPDAHAPRTTEAPADRRDADPDHPGEALPVSPGPILLTALSLQGIPYVNGGASPAGFDCSGLVQWVFAQHGIRLPREVRDQYDVGEKVDRDEVHPGDLVFFHTVSRGASHVGIALDGERFVHAPSSRGVVRVERFTSSYWAARYVGARRVDHGQHARAGMQ